MKKIIFDLDGTLVDSKPRLYRLFTDLLPQHGFSFEAYWDLKRKQVGHGTILKELMGRTTEEETIFQKTWMEEIEKQEYLQLDQPFPGVTTMLQSLKEKGNPIFLVTSRQSEEQLGWQLQHWGWSGLFDKVLVTRQEKEKEVLIREHINGLTHKDMIVGDTGKDIETGKSLGLVTVGVLSGFRDEEALKKYNPDFLVDHVTDIDFTR